MIVKKKGLRMVEFNKQEHPKKETIISRKSILEVPVCHMSRLFELGWLNQNSSEDAQINPD